MKATMAGALLLLCAAACSAPRRDAAFRPLSVGDRAPAYVAHTLAGDSVRVGTGTPVLLNVWATWCESCREEMADLAALEQQYQPRGVKVVAVSVDAGDGTRVRRFAESEHLPFAVAHDPDGEVQREFQAVGVPETYLVSGDGRLLWVRRGGLAGGGGGGAGGAGLGDEGLAGGGGQGGKDSPMSAYSVLLACSLQLTAYGCLPAAYSLQLTAASRTE